ncbi:MAG: translation initiation factor IF-2 [Patescibacteria group bacterium]
MSKITTTQKPSIHTVRPPVVVVMGHIDHGKSTLLDYIRKTNVVDKEVGGITQRMSAYEVIHKNSTGEHPITFLDTPGHESFGMIRARGASAADIAILVVSAEDGVKPQTLDALKAIKTANLPYIVGVSKIDKDNANLDRTKQSLAENQIYVEGYGGDISCVPFSGKTGEGVPDLLDMVLLTAEVADFKADASAPAEAIVIESNRDKVRGISATLIIKNGTLHSGTYVVAGEAISPVRILENFLGKSIKSAKPSEPARVIGWDSQPEVGGVCFTYEDKKSAEKYVEEERSRKIDDISKTKKKDSIDFSGNQTDISIVPILVKADTSGSVEAVKYEISKLQIDRVTLRVVSASTGDIAETDVKTASSIEGTLIIGFNVKADSSSKEYANRHGVQIHTFDIIYKMTEWLEEHAKDRAPKIQIEEETGAAKILRVFSVNKDKQVLGGRTENGTLSVGEEVKIMRRESEIGRGRIRELQQAKQKTGSVSEGEFGTMIESKLEIAPGDHIVAFHTVTK